MNIEVALLIVAGILLIAILIIIYCTVRLRDLHAQIRILREGVESESKKRVEKSRSVILGQVAEHFAPLIHGFGYNLKDARFVGQPVDYLIFNGLNDEELPESAGTAETGIAKKTRSIEIVLCEIKSGESRLSATERAIRDAVEAGRVRFELLRLANDGSFHVE